MDVVLGVAVTGPVARLALLGRGADVIDQSVVDLGDDPVGKLTETVVGTNRLLADENHRLVGTRLCWGDDPHATQLRETLENSGVANVAVLSESQAVSALMRAAGRPGAALVMDDETATLSVVGSGSGDADAPPTMLAKEPLAGAAGGDATAMFDTMMAKLGATPDAPNDIYLLGASPDLTRVADQLRDGSTMRVQIADDPTFALARGAAMAGAAQAAPVAGVAGDATAMAPAAALTGDETTVVPPSPDAEEPQLAYSMAGDAELVPGEVEEYGPPEYDDFETEAVPTRLNRRALVISNAVIAFAVIGFASLAVAVAVAVRPTASQQPVVGHQNAAPGKFMPLLPTQQQAPVPPPPVDAPNAGFQGGTIPDANGFLPSPGAGGTPAPVSPGIPGFVPNTNVPIPEQTTTTPTTTTPTTTTTPPTTTTTTTTPTTTTTTPTTTTTTTTPTTTTTTPTTTTPTTTTPTTTTPTTSTQTPATAAQPPSANQTTVAPPHTQSQQPLPQQPHTGGGHLGF